MSLLMDGLVSLAVLVLFFLFLWWDTSRLGKEKKNLFLQRNKKVWRPVIREEIDSQGRKRTVFRVEKRPPEKAWTPWPSYDAKEWWN